MTKRVTLLDEMNDAERKRVDLARVFEYFPDALIELALTIDAGQRQHGTAEWDKNKSKNHHGSLLRHMLQAGTDDKDGRRHSGKVAWRALAALQIEIETERALAAKARRNGRARAVQKRSPRPRRSATRTNKRP